MKTLDIALLATFATLLLFVSFVSVCNVNGIQIQDSLITTFLGIVGAEIATCGGITIFKVKHGKKSKPRQTKSENDKIDMEDRENE